MKKRSLFIGVICLVCVMSTWAAGSQQQSAQGGSVWPSSRNVEILLAAGAGSGTDAVVRTVAAYLTKKLGVNFYVTNDASGGGTVAYERMRNGVTDGSTFLVAPTGMMLQSHFGVYNYTINDFTLITDFQVPVEQPMIVVKGDSKYNTLKDFIDDAKARPNMVSVGCGTMTPILAKTITMEKVFGVTFRKVDGNDNAERIAAILGGYQDFMLAGAADVDSYVQNGDLKYLAYFWNEPSELKPDVPTVKDFGYTVPHPDLFNGHYPILGPKGMDEKIANAIAESLKGIEEDQVSRETLWKLEGGYPIYTSRTEGIELIKNIDNIAKTVAEEAK